MDPSPAVHCRGDGPRRFFRKSRRDDRRHSAMVQPTLRVDDEHDPDLIHGDKSLGYCQPTLRVEIPAVSYSSPENIGQYVNDGPDATSGENVHI